MAEILDNKHPSSPSVFRATALLREARRQKGLSTVDCQPSASSIQTATSCAGCVRRGVRSRFMDGPAITPNWIPSILQERLSASLAALSVLRLQF